MYKELPQPRKKQLPVVPALSRSLRQEDHWSPSVLGQAVQHSKTHLMKYLHRTFKVNKEQYTTRCVCVCVCVFVCVCVHVYPLGKGYKGTSVHMNVKATGLSHTSSPVTLRLPYSLSQSFFEPGAHLLCKLQGSTAPTSHAATGDPD